VVELKRTEDKNPVVSYWFSVLRDELEAAFQRLAAVPPVLFSRRAGRVKE
jgi:hypothetical protein